MNRGEKSVFGLLAGSSGSRTFGCVRIDWYPQFGKTSLNVLWFLGNNQVDSHVFTPSNPNYDQSSLEAANCKLESGRYQVSFEEEEYVLRGSLQYCNYDFINDKWICTPFNGEIGNGKLS